MDIQYSDGRRTEARLLSLVRQAKQTDASISIAHESYAFWPIRYHLSAERSNLLRPFQFEGLEVLELGAGMGAISRFLAEQSRSLYVVEGTQARFDVLKERLRGLGNWDGEVGNFQAFETARRFDVVCLIGVLEYSEQFLAERGEAAHRWLLEHCRKFLKPGGVLIVAIENALGLKYWNGAAEDHRGTPFDGICGYPDTPTARTFSRKQLKTMITSAGFAKIDEFFPFPDYKVPSALLHSELLARNPLLAAELSSQVPSRDYLGLPTEKCFPDSLAAHQLSRAGLLGDFANSFLFACSENEDSPIRRRLLWSMIDAKEIGWYFTLTRRHPTKTVFVADGAANRLNVVKTALFSRDFRQAYPTQEGSVLHWEQTSEPVLDGPSLRTLLQRHAYFGQWNPFLKVFENFLRWSFDRWAIDGTDRLQGAAVDAVFLNARLCEGAIYDPALPPTAFETFDGEWRLDGDLSRSGFVLNNVANLCRESELLCSSAPFRNLAELYSLLCGRLGVKANLAEDLNHTAAFLAAASGADASRTKASLSRLLGKKFKRARFPRSRRGFAGRARRAVAQRVLPRFGKYRIVRLLLQNA